MSRAGAGRASTDGGLVAAWRSALADAGLADAGQAGLTGIVRDLAATAQAPWSVRADGFYARAWPAGVTLPGQGWKIHVSARPENASDTLTRCADVLIRRGTPFKFAEDLAVAYALVSARYERSGAAKFLVAYPDGPDCCATLLAELALATAGLPAARVTGARRYRADAPVYYRFGAIAGPATLTAEGRISHPLKAPGGSLVPDDRLTFRPPSWAPPLPGIAPSGSAAQPALIGQYPVTTALRLSTRGGVFLAASRQDGQPVVIKQARAHTGVGLDGSDARDQLRREVAALQALAGTGLVPPVRELIETADSSFLVLGQVSGDTLRRWLRDRWRPPGAPTALVHHVAVALAAGLAAVHEAGWVLGDLSPSNCLVTEEAATPAEPAVRFVDLEFAAPAGDLRPAGYTPGYGAPEQAGNGLTPRPAETSADLYALGGILCFLVSAADPVGPAAAVPDPPAVAGPGADAQVRAVWLAGLALRDPDPAARPAAKTVAAELAGPRQTPSPPRTGPPPASPAPTNTDLMAELAASGARYLLATMAEQEAGTLWPVPGWLPRYDPASFDHGAAGPLLALAGAARRGLIPAAPVLDGADWLARHAARSAAILPGLHSGRSGALWALADAADLATAERRRGLLEAVTRLGQALPATGPPGMAGGLAGAGLAALRLWQLTDTGPFKARALDLASQLAATPTREEDLPARTGQAVFLAAAGILLGQQAWRLVARRLMLDCAEAMATLLDRVPSLPVESALTALSAERGVAGALRWGQIARSAGAVWPAELTARAAALFTGYACAAPPGFACGIAGWLDGLLSAHDDVARQAAGRLAAELAARRAPDLGLVPDDSGHGWCADFAHGVAGVSYAAARFAYGGPTLWDLTLWDLTLWDLTPWDPVC